MDRARSFPYAASGSLGLWSTERVRFGTPIWRKAFERLPLRTRLPRMDRAPRTDAPRANRDPGELERKDALLGSPRVAPLTAYVERLRKDRPDALIPYFDPTEAGVEATILGLFEAPGPKSAPPSGSGFVSADNDDQTAQNMWTLLRETGIDRADDYVAWNVVPWYLGDGTRIRAARADDLVDARQATESLLGLLPKMRVVVLFGKKAAQAWRDMGGEDALEAPHPSPRNLNGRPEARERIRDVLAEAKKLASAR